MCKCRPEIKTPFCGRPGCEWPKQREQAPSKEKFAKVDKILNDMLAIRNVHGDEFVSVHTFGGYLNVENARLLRDWLNKALPVSAHEPRAPRSDDNLHLDEESGAVSVDHAAIVAAIRRERTEKADATPYMLNGTRFKLAFNNRGETSSFAGYHPQLHGRWVALVDATDDRHMRAAQPPPSEHPDKARIDWLNDQPVHFIELDDFSIIDAKGLDVRTAIDAKRSAPTKESCL